MRQYLVILFMAIAGWLTAQEKITISGYITDSESEEAIIGANLWVSDKLIGTNSNNYGFFSLSLPNDSLEIKCSAVGYEELTFKLNGHINPIHIKMQPRVYQLEMITIHGVNPDQPKPRSIEISGKSIKEFPALFGESDPLKLLQTIPGIKQGSEGSAQLYVRGGTPDQNLILLDGVPLYNVYHVFGFFSVFNNDIIKNIKVHKAGIPANYDSRLSSVIDIATLEGNLKEKKKSFSISPISGSLKIESPIKKDKSSILVSGRYTWQDILFRLFTLGSDTKRGFNFYDFNIKYQDRLNEKNSIYVSTYSSRDKFYDQYHSLGSKSNFDFQWGNYTGLIRWNTIINNKMFLKSSIYYSKYFFNQKSNFKDNQVSSTRLIKSNIQELNYNSTLEYLPTSNHELKSGLQIAHRIFTPEALHYRDNSNSFDQPATLNNTSNSVSIFIDDKITLTRQINFYAGFRTMLYFQSNNLLVSPQPRASLSIRLKENTFQLHYDKIDQSIHLLTNTSLGQPTDLWVAATPTTPPATSHQFSIGYRRTFNGYSLMIDGYYKLMEGVIQYKEGANYIYGINEDWEDKVTIGIGSSKGIELSLSKDIGNLRGTASYTLSRTMRQFDGINNGKPFPFKYDRTHDGNILLKYHLSANKTLSTFFTYNTGNAFTLPIGKAKGSYLPNWQFVNQEETTGNSDLQNITIDHNNVRMPAYHRLDISYSSSKELDNGHIRSWTFSIYNVYNRLNPYFLFEDGGQIKQYAFFPIIPSVNYTLSF